MRNRIHILNQETASDSVELFNYMDENQFSDWTELFDSNPDLVKVDDREIPFTHIEDKNFGIIIYIDVEYTVDRNSIEKLLKKFFSGNFRKYFEKQDLGWKGFTNDCIAYRDGEGTFYCIWKCTS